MRAAQPTLKRKPEHCQCCLFVEQDHGESYLLGILLLPIVWNPWKHPEHSGPQQEFFLKDLSTFQFHPGPGRSCPELKGSVQVAALYSLPATAAWTPNLHREDPCYSRWPTNMWRCSLVVGDCWLGNHPKVYNDMYLVEWYMYTNTCNMYNVLWTELYKYIFVLYCSINTVCYVIVSCNSYAIYILMEYKYMLIYYGYNWLKLFKLKNDRILIPSPWLPDSTMSLCLPGPHFAWTSENQLGPGSGVCTQNPGIFSKSLHSHPIIFQAPAASIHSWDSLNPEASDFR